MTFVRDGRAPVPVPPRGVFAGRPALLACGLLLAALPAAPAFAQSKPVDLTPPRAESAAPKPKAIKPATDKAKTAKPTPTRTAAKPALDEPDEAEAKAAPVPQRTDSIPARLAGDSFGRFIESLWPDAQARGVSRATFDMAFKGVTPDAAIIALTRKQSEFVAPIWSYLAGAVSPQRLSRGAEMRQRYGDVLARVEQQFGVPAAVVLGVWGMETNFGSFTGGKDVIRSLATLAQARYRGDFFRDELLKALVILQKGLAGRDEMRGSWAGAMGQTQFMPSSYLEHAVDYDRDGHPDIWSSVPDALASTANYLKHYGWEPGLPWGMEVALPQGGYDFAVIRDSFAGWARRGFARAGGGALPGRGEATLFAPAGAGGPVFLVTANYEVIKKYNSSDAYALGVAHLGDRLMGRAPIQGSWPTREKQLAKAEREEIQRLLKKHGHYSGTVDGKLGSGTRDAVRRFQQSIGHAPPDGYPSGRVLAKLRGA